MMHHVDALAVALHRVVDRSGRPMPNDRVREAEAILLDLDAAGYRLVKVSVRDREPLIIDAE